MPDPEKVIRGLENCRDCSPVDGCPKECPYWTNENPTGCCTFIPLLDDAITLLREQEEIIDRYHNADAFLDAHGWRWDNA